MENNNKRKYLKSPPALSKYPLQNNQLSVPFKQSRQDIKTFGVSSLNVSRIVNKTQRGQLKQQQSILNDYDVLLNSKRNIQNRLQNQNNQDDNQKSQNQEQLKHNFQEFQQELNNNQLTKDKIYQLNAKYNNAIELLKQHQQSNMTASNSHHLIKAFQYLLQLIEAIRNKRIKHIPFALAQNIVLNFWKVSKDLLFTKDNKGYSKQIGQNQRAIQQSSGKNQQTQQETILSMVQQCLEILQEMTKTQTIKYHRISQIYTFIVKQYYYRKNMDLALQNCFKGFKCCPKFKNSSILLKLHYIRSKIYNFYKSFQPQYQDIKKTLYYLGIISSNANQKKQFSIELIRQLMKRKLQLQAIIENKQKGPEPFKFYKEVDKEDQEKRNANSLHNKNDSKHKFRTKSISATKLKQQKLSNQQQNYHDANNFNTNKKQLQKFTSPNRSIFNNVMTTQMNSQNKKDFLKLDINRKSKLKKKGKISTVWQKNQERINMQNKISKELESLCNRPYLMKQLHMKQKSYQNLILRRPNASTDSKKQKISDTGRQNDYVQEGQTYNNPDNQQYIQRNQAYSSNLQKNSDNSSMRRKIQKTQLKLNSQNNYSKEKVQTIFSSKDNNLKQQSIPNFKQQEGQESSESDSNNVQNDSKFIDEKEEMATNNYKNLDNQQNKIGSNNLNESNSNEKYKSRTYAMVKDVQQQIFNKFLSKNPILRTNKKIGSHGLHQQDKIQANGFNQNYFYKQKQQIIRSSLYNFTKQKQSNAQSIIQSFNPKLVKRKGLFNEQIQYNYDSNDFYDNDDFQLNQISQNSSNDQTTSQEQEVLIKHLISKKHKNNQIITIFGIIQEMSVQIYKNRNDAEDNILQDNYRNSQINNSQKNIIAPTIKYIFCINMVLNGQYYELEMSFDFLKSQEAINQLPNDKNKKGQHDKNKNSLNNSSFRKGNDLEKQIYQWLRDQFILNSSLQKNVKITPYDDKPIIHHETTTKHIDFVNPNNIQYYILCKILSNLTKNRHTQFGYTVLSQKDSQEQYEIKKRKQDKKRQLFQYRQKNFGFITQSNQNNLNDVEWKKIEVEIQQKTDDKQCENTHQAPENNNNSGFSNKYNQQNKQLKDIQLFFIQIERAEQTISANDHNQQSEQQKQENQQQQNDNQKQKQSSSQLQLTQSQKTNFQVNKYTLQSKLSSLNVLIKDLKKQNNINHRDNNAQRKGQKLRYISQFTDRISQSVYPILKYLQIITKYNNNNSNTDNLRINNLKNFDIIMDIYNENKQNVPMLKQQTQCQQIQIYDCVQNSKILLFETQNYDNQSFTDNYSYCKKISAIQNKSKKVSRNLSQTLSRLSQFQQNLYKKCSINCQYQSTYSKWQSQYSSSNLLKNNSKSMFPINQNPIIEQSKNFVTQQQSVLSNKKILYDIQILKILKNSLIQPEYNKSILLNTYFQMISVTSFSSIMGLKPNYIKLTCFRMKPIYTEQKQKNQYFYLFQLQQQEARTRMHKFIIEDKEIVQLFTIMNCYKSISQTKKSIKSLKNNTSKNLKQNEIREGIRFAKTLPYKNKMMVDKQSLVQEQRKPNQRQNKKQNLKFKIQNKPQVHESRKLSIKKNKELKRCFKQKSRYVNEEQVVQKGKQNSQISYQTNKKQSIKDLQYQMTTRQKQITNQKGILFEFNKQSLMNIIKFIAPYLIIKKNYLYTSICINYQDKMFYLMNKFYISEQRFLKINSKEILTSKYKITNDVLKDNTKSNPQHYFDTTNVQNQIGTDSELKINNSQSQQINVNVKPILPQNQFLVRKFKNTLMNQSLFLNKQIKSKKILCQTSIILSVSQNFIYQIKSHKQKKGNHYQNKNINKNLHIATKQNINSSNKKNSVLQSTYNNNKPTITKLFSILTIIKIQRSKYFTIKLYIPKFQRSYTLTLDVYVLNYFTLMDLYDVFEGFQQVQGLIEQLKLIEIQNNENEKFKNKGNYKVDRSEDSQQIISREQFFNSNAHRFKHNRQRKQTIIESLIQFIFQKQYDPNKYKLLWKRIINLIQVEQRNTEDKVYLIMKLSSYEGFIKDSSLIQFIQKNNSIFLLEMTMNKISDKNHYFPKNSQIDQFEGEKVKRGVLTPINKNSLLYKQAVSKQQSKKCSLQKYKKTTIINPRQINQHNQQFQKISQIYESKTENYILYVQLFKIYDQNPSKSNKLSSDYKYKESNNSNSDLNSQSVVYNDKYKNRQKNNQNQTEINEQTDSKNHQRRNINYTKKKSTIKSININLNNTKLLSKKNQKTHPKRIRLTKKNLTAKKSEKQSNQSDSDITKINFSFYLSQLKSLFSFIDRKYSTDLNEQYFVLSQIHTGFKVLKKIIVDQFIQIGEKKSFQLVDIKNYNTSSVLTNYNTHSNFMDCTMNNKSVRDNIINQRIKTNHRKKNLTINPMHKDLKVTQMEKKWTEDQNLNQKLDDLNIQDGLTFQQRKKIIRSNIEVNSKINYQDQQAQQNSCKQKEQEQIQQSLKINRIQTQKYNQTLNNHEQNKKEKEKEIKKLQDIFTIRNINQLYSSFKCQKLFKKIVLIKLKELVQSNEQNKQQMVEDDNSNGKDKINKEQQIGQLNCLSKYDQRFNSSAKQQNKDSQSKDLLKYRQHILQNSVQENSDSQYYDIHNDTLSKLKQNSKFQSQKNKYKNQQKEQQQNQIQSMLKIQDRTKKLQHFNSLHSSLSNQSLIDLHILSVQKQAKHKQIISSLFYEYNSLIFVMSNIKQFNISTVSINLQQQHPFLFIKILQKKRQLKSIKNRLFKFYKNLLVLMMKKKSLKTVDERRIN